MRDAVIQCFGCLSPTTTTGADHGGTAANRPAWEKVGPTNLTGILEDLNLYARYRATIDGILKILGDLNSLTVDIHAGSGFQEIVNALEKRLTG